MISNKLKNIESLQLPVINNVTLSFLCSESAAVFFSCLMQYFKPVLLFSYVSQATVPADSENESTFWLLCFSFPSSWTPSAYMLI